MDHSRRPGHASSTRHFPELGGGNKGQLLHLHPEAYDSAEKRRFPVLYWLHGSGGGLAGVKPLVEHFESAIRAGKIPPMLVVFPNGLASSMWCDSKYGKIPMETIVLKELLPHIDATYRTITSAAGRIIEGFSMGGYGAAHLGFKRPDLFGAVSMLGGGPLQREFKVTEAPRASPQGAQRLFDTVYGVIRGISKPRVRGLWRSRIVPYFVRRR